MKKTLAIIMFTVLSFNSFAKQSGFVSESEQNASQAGFKGGISNLTSVNQAKGLRDETWVVLEGYIVKKISHEIYEFRDDSGIINVDIDDNLWMGQSISPKNKVRIEGDVDKDWNSVEIDIKNVRIINK